MNLQIENSAMANVAAPPADAVMVVRVGFQILVPGLSPPGAGNGRSVDYNGVDVWVFLFQLF